MSETATINRIKYLVKRIIDHKEGDYYSKEHYARELWCAEDWLMNHHGWQETSVKLLEIDFVKSLA